MKRLFWSILTVFAVLIAVAVGAGMYMLRYSLSPEEEREDTARYFRQLTEQHPEVVPWLDSLRACEGLRDTFVLMPSGERHHAYFIRRTPGQPVAIVLHGWRDSAIKFMYIGRIYHQQLGYNVLLPDLHAHGLSEGEVIGMGWKERHDVLHWMTVAAQLFQSDEFVVHGVSMGAATAMNVSGLPMPKEVRTVRFVEDCGYTSVWDEFSYELREEFHLPAFPLMYTTSLLCRLRNGWSFGEASSLRQVEKCHWPMLFIHGDNDHFVPSWMVHPLYEAKPGRKSLWTPHGTQHAMAYGDYTEEYIRQVRAFMQQQTCRPLHEKSAQKVKLPLK